MQKSRPLLIIILILTFITPSQAETPITGHPDPNLKSLDDFFLTFLEKNNLPAVSVAITKNGKLVYARAFGYANTEEKEKAQPTSLFRLASVSKPFTAAAILQLVEQEKLDLQKTHPFQDLKPNPILTGKNLPDPRLEKITLRELLQHRAGFDRDASLDPMFQSVNFAKLTNTEPPAMQPEIIRVMAGRPLDFDPGDHYCYSNFGYCVLGREIEHISKEPYETYIQKHLLEPLNITDMQIGRSLKKDRAKNEVTYYVGRTETGKTDQVNSVFPPFKKVPEPYGGWCIEAMDSHGAWIATAADVVKFASEFDDPKSCRLLKPKAITEMFARPPGKANLVDQKENNKPADTWYACGWQVRTAGNGLNTWHTGLLAGTSTLLVRRSDGLDWAILFNQDSTPKGDQPANLIDGPMHAAVDAITKWPEGKTRDEKWP